RVIFVRHERAIDEDLFDADLPQLANHDFQVAYKLFAPTHVPTRRAYVRSSHEVRCAQLRQRHRVVAFREKPVARERWQGHRLRHSIPKVSVNANSCEYSMPGSRRRIRYSL